jgi:hypothetical protein
MYREAFVRAREEARKASDKIVAIRNARTLSEVADLWSSFLTHVQRSYTRLRIACRSGPSKGWCDEVWNTRNNDDLLKYVLHARNADEHGLAPITESKRGSIGLRPKKGNTLEVDHLTIGAGQMVMGPKLAANADIVIIPAEVLLVPVRDRSVQYDLPTKHLGKDVGPIKMIGVAEFAEAYLRGILDEADTKF